MMGAAGLDPWGPFADLRGFLERFILEQMISRNILQQKR